MKLNERFALFPVCWILIIFSLPNFQFLKLYDTQAMLVINSQKYIKKREKQTECTTRSLLVY